MDQLDIYEEMLNKAIEKGDCRLAESIINEMVDYCKR